MMRFVVFCSVLLAGLLAASEVAPGAASGPSPAAEMAMVLLYEQAPRHPQAAGFLRKLGIALGEGRIDLAEAERLVGLAAQLGMLTANLNLPGGPAVPPPLASSEASPRVKLDDLLDGPPTVSADVQPAATPATTVVTTASQPAEPPASPAPPAPPPAWRDVAGLGGRVLSMAEGPQQVKFVMIKPDAGAVFRVGQDFVVRNAGKDLVRGVITTVGMDPSKAIFGNLVGDSWAEGSAPDLKGGEIVVGISR